MPKIWRETRTVGSGEEGKKPNSWHLSPGNGVTQRYFSFSPPPLRELLICSWDIEQILLFLQDKWWIWGWVRSMRLLLPGATSKGSEKRNGPHKTGPRQKNAVVSIKHVVSCLAEPCQAELITLRILFWWQEECLCKSSKMGLFCVALGAVLVLLEV